MKNLKNTMIGNFRLPITLLAATIFVLTACDTTDAIRPDAGDEVYNEDTQTTTYYGPSKPLGDGVARTWVTLNKNGMPIAVGVAMSEKALSSLPGEHDHNHGAGHEYETVLQFHKVAEKTPFSLMTLGWNPRGHAPEQVYDKPHFDFHFYMISDEVRKAIPGLPDDQMDPEPPASRYLPADYMMLPGRVPAMGSHFIDVTSPELRGVPFTQTFILGGYKGRVVFYEPMITLAYLLSKPQATIPIKQPEAFQTAGYYPNSYRIEYDTKTNEYKVYLSDLTFRSNQ